MDGGVGGMSDTETRLAGFLFAIQPDRKKPDLSDAIEYAKREGFRIVGDPDEFPVSPMTKDMLDHERYLLEDPDAGNLWRHLRKEARFEYALLLYCLYRQRWAAKLVKMTNQLLLELDKNGLRINLLRTLRRIDPLSIERAREYKVAAARVPKRLRGTLKHLEDVTTEDSPLSSTARAALKQQVVDYRSFLKDYRQRRKHRFEKLAEYHFQSMAGKLKSLLDDSRGRPSLTNLARRASKAVFVELADELIHKHDVSISKSTLLAGQITCLLFTSERVTKKTDPFDKAYGKKALNEYKYAKESLGSV
jgi:hypothetical protein